MAQTGLKWAAVLTMAIAMSGCTAASGGPASIDEALGSPAAKPALPTGPVARAAVEVRTQQVPVPPVTPPVAHDTCGANSLAWLIGRPRTDIPVAVDMSRRRVACTACPVAPDVRLDRLNILFDANTGKVARLSCG
jgi:hypothetical protein